MRRLDFLPFGFFVLRTPLLPWETLEHFVTAPDKVPEQIRALAARPDVLEALEVATPVFAATVRSWLAGSYTDADGRLRQTLLKYVYRMAWRTTPYGLFAGTTTGTTGSVTQMILGPATEYEKRLFVDFAIMSRVAQWIDGTEAPRDTALVRANSSLYSLAGQLRFVERVIGDSGAISYTLSAVEADPVLSELVCLARDPVPVGSIINHLMRIGAEEADARAFTSELLRCGVLLGACAPPIISPDTFAVWRHRLSQRLPADHQLIGEVARIHQLLDHANASRLGENIAATIELGAAIATLPAAKGAKYLLDGRLLKQSNKVVLGAPVIDVVLEGLYGLAMAAAHRHSGNAYIPEQLRIFIERFRERYGEGPVPLCEALDVENGVGFPGAWEADTPTQTRTFDVSWTRRLQHEVGNALRDGRNVISIESMGLSEDVIVSEPLPEGAMVYGRVGAADAQSLARGDVKVYIMAVNAPAPLAALGRFCAADRALADMVTREMHNVDAEEAVPAELSYIGPGRAGNVAARPPLTRLEIDYLGAADTAGDDRILLSDLQISLESGRVALWSARLGMEIKPQLSTAHAAQQLRHLPVYRFLNSLKYQPAFWDLNWHWGSLDGMPFLPRVTYKKTILSLAQWTVGEKDLRPLRDASESSAHQEFVAFRERLRLPEIFCIAGDNESELLIDARCDIGRQLFVAHIRHRSAITIREQFPTPTELCTESPDGHFASEFMLPMRRKTTQRRRTATNLSKQPRIQYIPGGPWLYFKLYAGFATLDRLLIRVVQPLIAQHETDIERWFFLRYNDSAPHLRVRVRGATDKLWTGITETLRCLAGPLIEDSTIASVVFDTYAPEVTRYGGEEALSYAETIFWYDSIAAVKQLATMASLADERPRRLEVLSSMSALLRRLLPDADAASLSLYAFTNRDRMLGGTGETQSARTAALRQLSRQYRVDRQSIEEKLSQPEDVPELANVEDAAIVALRALSEAGRLARPYRSIVDSILHMHCNRRLRMNWSGQEIDMYDHLGRYFQSIAARTKVQ